MADLRITAGPFQFSARFEATAPNTVAAFRGRMPFDSTLVHVRWSGEAVWFPPDGLGVGVGYENATSYPAPGQILFYPGGLIDPEILIAYGPCQFASKAGQLAGNHFLSIVGDLDRLADLGRMILWQGAQPVRFEAG